MVCHAVTDTIVNSVMSIITTACGSFSHSIGGRVFYVFVNDENYRAPEEVSKAPPLDTKFKRPGGAKERNDNVQISQKDTPCNKQKHNSPLAKIRRVIPKTKVQVVQVGDNSADDAKDCPLSEYKKLEEAVLSMKNDKAPGPDVCFTIGRTYCSCSTFA